MGRNHDRYLELLDELYRIRSANGGEDNDESLAALDSLEVLWEELSEEEQGQIKGTWRSPEEA